MYNLYINNNIYVYKILYYIRLYNIYIYTYNISRYTFIYNYNTAKSLKCESVIYYTNKQF